MIELKPLTVAFHAPGFVRGLNGENQQGFWFQLSDAQRQRVGSPWGPGDPQSLNRYSYVRNAPLRWTDPSGHTLRLNTQRAQELVDWLTDIQRTYRDGSHIGWIAAALFGAAKVAKLGLLTSGIAGLTGLWSSQIGDFIDDITSVMATAPDGDIAITADCYGQFGVCHVTVMNLESGQGKIRRMSKLGIGQILFSALSEYSAVSPWAPGRACSVADDGQILCD